MYIVPNGTPQLGINNGNSQAVRVYDKKLDVKRNILTSPEEAEQFAYDRKHGMKKAGLIGTAMILPNIALNALFGGVFGRQIAVLHNSKLPKLNEHIVDTAQRTGKKGFDLLHHFFHEEKINKFISKKLLASNFSHTENLFKRLNVKTFAKRGGLIGAALGLPLALLAIPVRIQRAEDKITKQFIEDNKFNNTKSL